MPVTTPKVERALYLMREISLAEKHVDDLKQELSNLIEGNASVPEEVPVPTPRKRAPASALSFKDRDAKFDAALSKRVGITAESISKLTGMSVGAVGHRFNRLIEAGKLVRLKRGKYRLVPTVEVALPTETVDLDPNG